MVYLNVHIIFFVFYTQLICASPSIKKNKNRFSRFLMSYVRNFTSQNMYHVRDASILDFNKEHGIPKKNRNSHLPSRKYAETVLQDRFLENPSL